MRPNLGLRGMTKTLLHLGGVNPAVEIPDVQKDATVMTHNGNRPFADQVLNTGFCAAQIGGRLIHGQQSRANRGRGCSALHLGSQPDNDLFREGVQQAVDVESVLHCLQFRTRPTCVQVRES